MLLVGVSLFDSASLGIDKYMETRKSLSQQFNQDSRDYKNKMNEFVNNDSKAMVFTDDLKNMVHLCEAEDVDLMGKMINM